MNISLVRINRRFNTVDDLIPSKMNEMKEPEKENQPKWRKKRILKNEQSYVTTWKSKKYILYWEERMKKQTNKQTKIWRNNGQKFSKFPESYITP